MALAAISVLCVDLSKNHCSVVGLDAFGRVVMRRMRRETLIGLAEKLPRRVVGMEAAAAPIISAASSTPAATTCGSCRRNISGLMSRRRRTTIATRRGSRKR